MTKYKKRKNPITVILPPHTPMSYEQAVSELEETLKNPFEMLPFAYRLLEFSSQKKTLSENIY